MKTNPRKIALEILSSVIENKAYSNIAIEKYISNENLSHIDKRFIRQLVYGVIENMIFLDHIIASFSRTILSKIDNKIMIILRLGLYQLIFLDKVPDSAAVNESVNLAKEYNKKLSGFVNGILRNYIRNKDKVVFPDPNKDLEEYLSIKYSHPKWIVKRWLRDYGYSFTENLLKANNSVPPLSLRVNTLKISRDDLIDELNKEGVLCRGGELAPEAVIVESSKYNIEELDAYKKGWFQVQDESSMLVGHVLSPQENEIILDVCSAPGGKSTHLAQLMKNKGTIIARDIYDHKLRLIDENSKRLGINIIRTEKFDALEVDNNLIDKIDKVLVDAPCSGLGIIRRKPEIRYFRKKDDIKELTNLQYKILSTSSKYVKKNGVLVYSTCTIMKEENEALIEKFLKENKHFSIEDINDFLPKNLRSESTTLQLFPNIHNADGFFIARMKRKS